jgi:hypothetical protein
MKKISKTRLIASSLTQLTLLNICSLRARAQIDKRDGCLIAPKASVSLSKPDKSVFDFPAAHRNISFGGQV